MPENGTQLRSIAWTQVFPFVRLFRTFPLALDYTRLTLAFACVLILYAGGRVLDRAWIATGHGVLSSQMSSEYNGLTIQMNEVQIYASQNANRYREWRNATTQAAQDDKTFTAKMEGPFITLVEFESRCFAGAVLGVWSGNLGVSGTSPALLSSGLAAWKGGLWLVTQHTWYALVYGIFYLIVFALFGGAICRSAAMQSARDERISIGEAFRFSREKFGGLLWAKLFPIVIFVGIAAIMIVGGLVAGLFAKIPGVGGLFLGVPFVLAILGGFALAVLFIATVLGWQLMWPTIAVEGSDGFDAASRAWSYTGSRIWHLGFYTAVLLSFGGLCYTLVRLVVLFVLKLTHTFVGWGANVFDSSVTGYGKLDVMWRMPGWNDLALLPDPTGPSLWGRLGSTSMSTGDWLGYLFISIWVFIVIGLLVAFVISYCCTGAVQMYFLLRRDVDATDYDEIYYEEPAESAATAFVAVSATTTATPEAEAPDNGESSEQPGPSDN